MPEHKTPAERYRQLAEECLDVAHNFSLGEARDALIHMAQVWARLADSYADSTTALFPRVRGEQLPMQQQQQQQLQPKAESEDKS